MSIKQRFGAALRAFADPQLIARPSDLSKLVETRITQALDQDRMTALMTQAIKHAGPGGDELAKQDQQANAWSKGPDRWARVRDMAHKALKDGGVSSGDMLEIGGRLNPRDKDFSAFTYHSLDLDGAPGGLSNTMIGDLTQCPEIPDASFDFIFSFDVFEHIDRPWLAAAETQRLLKPGGVTVHSTLFAWRYHPCPIDYWRYTAEGLKSLFPDLTCLHSAFDYTERRRDVRGRGGNAMKPDAFGGWRENVRVNYAGQKPK